MTHQHDHQWHAGPAYAWCSELGCNERLGHGEIAARFNLLQRAARAVSYATDCEASFYEAQYAVEAWAIDAMESVLSGDTERATVLLDRYEEAEWDEGENPRCEYDCREEFSRANA